MSWGILLPAAALAAATLAAMTAFIEAAAGSRMGRLHARLITSAAVLAAAAFLHLVVRFILADVSLEYVFLYTRVGLPLRYRIAGAWAGREGSLLLWAAYTAIVAAWFMHRSRRVEANAATDAPLRIGHAWTRFFLAASAVVFLAASVHQNAFADTDAALLKGFPEGRGLNPTLLSPFILIHPPMMFLAYALTAIPAAAALGHLVSGSDRWGIIALPWARCNWLLYTLAMGLGGMWAYYTLGFGGYWAWDPVEVANLLPWLALTVLLHAMVHHARHGSHRVAGPFLALLPFLLTVFSTISTRSGLWVSVHAFTDPSAAFAEDPLRRFLDIMEAAPGLPFFVGLMLGVFCLGLALWSRRLAAQEDRLHTASRIVAALLAAFAAMVALWPRATVALLFEGARALPGSSGMGLLVLGLAAVLGAAAPALVAPDPTASGHGAAASRRAGALDMGRLSSLAVVILGLGLLVLFLFHMAAVRGWSTEFYLQRAPFLAIPAALGILLLVARPYGTRSAVGLAAAVAVAAVLAALLADNGAGAALVAVTIPLSLVALDRVGRAVRPSTSPRGRVAALALLAGAIANVVFWVNPPSRIGFAPLSLTAAWPVQLFAGAAAFVALHLSLRHLAGATQPRGLAPLAVAILGGFFVAPLLATAAYVLEKPASAPPTGPSRAATAKLRQAGLYMLHLSLALALVGYALSSNFSSSAEGELRPGESLAVGGQALRFDGATTRPDPGLPWAREVLVEFTVTDADAGSARGSGDATLYWEPQTGSHYPLPATVRLWDRDVYYNVDAICFVAGGACTTEWVQAYQSGGRVSTTAEASAVQVTAATLPGLGLVWAALFSFVYAMALVLGTERQGGQPLGARMHQDSSRSGGDALGGDSDDRAGGG
jgi:cytochrome c biogenesis factor